jgi:pyruvate/2-oxoglutarate dehydrogenase complex dihydrolipoamide acyltransferase (E2) component
MEVRVPDIGDFADVPVIEILVSVGDTVAPEDPLVTLESDKATMDVPSPAAGTITKLLVKLDDRVAEGTVLLELEPVGAESSSAEPRAGNGGSSSQPASAPLVPLRSAPTLPVMRRLSSSGRGRVDIRRRSGRRTSG